jgi:hypothetical protein
LSWKNVPQNIHGNASSMGWDNLLPGTIHFICINITSQEPETSQTYLDSSQYLLLLFYVVCSERYEIQWQLKMLHRTTLLPWMERWLVCNRWIVLTPRAEVPLFKYSLRWKWASWDIIYSFVVFGCALTTVPAIHNLQQSHLTVGTGRCATRESHKLKTRILGEIATILQEELQNAMSNLFFFSEKIYCLWCRSPDRHYFKDAGQCALVLSFISILI